MPRFCWKCGSPPQALGSLLDPLPTNPSSAVARLLRSNDAPLESELPVICDIISDAQDRIAALDAQIRQLQATIPQLIQRRDETIEHVRQHRMVLASVRRVPQELICEIFALSVAHDRAIAIEERLERGRMYLTHPWRLGLICRPWRQYAISYPPLWSYITVTVPVSDYWLDSELLKLEAQLLRTANAPLDIYWYNPRNITDYHMMDLILPHCSRWRTLYIRVNTSSIVLDWLDPVNGHLDRLEKLEVVNARFTTFPDVFAAAPKLREVNLTGWDYMPSPPTLPSIRLPPGQLTHYRGEYPLTRQLEILRAAPNLVECALGIRGLPNDPLADTTVVLPHLRRLCLGQADAFHVNLTAPALTDLCCLGTSTKAVTLLLPFVHRTSCTLTKLALWDCRLNPNLTAALRDLPTLTYLLLQNESHKTQRGVSFFDAMAVSDICPHLTVMVYGYMWWEDESLDSFVGMARCRFRSIPSRSTVLSQLRLFSRHESRSQAPSAKTRCTSLREEGYDVVFLSARDVPPLVSEEFWI